MQYRSDEWAVIIGAYIYEILHKEWMSDSSFDTRCELLETDIEDFSVSTGYWIHSLIPIIGNDFLKEVSLKAIALGEGTDPKWFVPKENICDN